MKSGAEKKSSTTSKPAAQQVSQGPFFSKTSEGGFFDDTKAVQRTTGEMVQRQGPVNQPQPKKKTIQEINIEALQKSFKEWAIMDKILDPMVRELAKSYLNSPLGKLETPDRVIYDTPYGGPKVIRGIHPPSEARVVSALKPQMKLKKIGKGNDPKDWTWTWSDTSTHRAKTPDEKVLGAGKWAAEEFIQGRIEKKYITPLVVKPAVESAVKWLATREIMVTASFLTGAGEVIAVGMLIYSIADLLLSLGEPVEKELSPYQQESVYIVGAVRGYLEEKKDAEDRKKELAKPFQPYPTVATDPPILNIPKILGVTQ